MPFTKIDYKLTNVTLSSQGISAKVRIYGGGVTTEQEPDLNGDLADVTRYRRTAGMIKEIDINLDPTQVTELFSKWVNKKLIEEATTRGKEVISEQASTSV